MELLINQLEHINVFKDNDICYNKYLIFKINLNLYLTSISSSVFSLVA